MEPPMPSPQIVAREPGRRIRGKSRKPERRAKGPVDVAEADMDAPTPSHQSSKAGSGVGGGRERARRVSERMPKAAGAKAHAKSKAGTMMSRSVEKKLLARADKGQPTDHLASPKAAIRKQPRRQGAKKQSRAAKAANGATKRAAAPPEAAPTQKQVLRGKAPRKRTLRNQGVQ
jgi:hypothetical protein